MSFPALSPIEAHMVNNAIAITFSLADSAVQLYMMLSPSGYIAVQHIVFPTPAPTDPFAHAYLSIDRSY